MARIAIDPGHGGGDSGTVAINGVLEKDLNLSVALLVKRMLETHGVQTLMTRVDDSDVNLAERVAMANRNGVDAFVSIHHNSCDNPEVRGYEVFYSVLGGPGQELALSVLRRLQSLSLLPTRGAKTREGRDGGDYYYVIRYTKMPSIIVELGFLSNAADTEYCSKAEGQQAHATAISQGILNWLGYDIGTRVFADVEPGRWSEEAIRRVRDSGIMMGYPDGTFRPMRAVTREELAAVVARILDTDK